jgi:hypothetical protein
MPEAGIEEKATYSAYPFTTGTSGEVPAGEAGAGWSPAPPRPAERSRAGVNVIARLLGLVLEV